MEMKKRLITVGTNSRHPALLGELTKGGYTLIPPYEGKGESVLLPMPYTTDGVHVTGDELTLRGLFADLPRGTAVLGGRLDREAYLCAAEYGTRLFDYFTPEWVQIMNADLTASAAVRLAAERLRRQGTRVLVCGFGRIGRCLMKRLTDMSVDASVSLRSEKDAAWAQVMGYRAVRLGEEDLSSYHLIFNTVPSVILGERELRSLWEEVRIIDLASAPYGVDFTCAEALGIKVTVASGLPGKIYPERAGAILGQSVLRILEGEGL